MTFTADDDVWLASLSEAVMTTGRACTSVSLVARESVCHFAICARTRRSSPAASSAQGMPMPDAKQGHDNDHGERAERSQLSGT